MELHGAPDDRRVRVQDHLRYRHLTDRPPALSEETWARIAPLFDPHRGRTSPESTLNRTLAGMIHKFRTGVPWHQIPPKYGHWNTIFRRYKRWSQDPSRQKILLEIIRRAPFEDPARILNDLAFKIPTTHRYPATRERQMVEGILWKFHTGAPWREMPSEFGNWNSVYKQYSRWCEAGTWDQIWMEVHGSSSETAPHPNSGSQVGSTS